MKFFSLIVGALVLYLSVMPCCEGGDSCIDGNGEAQKTLPVDHEDETGSPCSPFYSCGACVGFVVAGRTDFVSDLGSIVSEEEVSHLALNRSIGYFFSLIKPPMPLS